MLKPFTRSRSRIGLLGALVICGLVSQTLLYGAPDSATVTTRLGLVELTSDSSLIGPSCVVYTNAKMTAADGTTVNADDLRANIADAGSIVTLKNIVLTGHVRAHIEQPGRTMSVSTDKAVYDPKANNIALTGNVRAEVGSKYTAGPWVQTGDSGTILLGHSADYPQLVMYHVHTTFTPVQPK